jgi:hypothetical protein
LASLAVHVEPKIQPLRVCDFIARH